MERLIPAFFTLLPLLTGEEQEHHGEIVASADSIAGESKLKPMLNANHFSRSEIDAAYAAVGSGSLGKVVIDIVILNSDGLILSPRLNPSVRMQQNESNRRCLWAIRLRLKTGHENGSLSKSRPAYADRIAHDSRLERSDNHFVFRFRPKGKDVD